MPFGVESFLAASACVAALEIGAVVAGAVVAGTVAVDCAPDCVASPVVGAVDCLGARVAGVNS